MANTTPAKHTPGPWEFEHARGFDRVQDQDICERIYACDPGPELDFTIGFVRDADLEQRTANARLIAAAPAMLEALESLLDVVEYGREHTAIQFRKFCFGHDARFTHADIAKAEAAIRLAKGEL